MQIPDNRNTHPLLFSYNTVTIALSGDALCMRANDLDNDIIGIRKAIYVYTIQPYNYIHAIYDMNIIIAYTYKIIYNI